MADFSMYGAEASGTRLHEQDQLNNFLKTVQGVQGLSGARLQNAQATKLESGNAAQAKLAELVRGRRGGGATAPQTDVASQLEGLARDAFDAGLFEEASKHAEGVSKIRAEEARAEAAKALARGRVFDATRKVLDIYGAEMGQARSQEDFDRANAHYTFLAGEPAPGTGRQWSPQLADQLSRMTVSRKEQIELAMRKAEDEDEARTRASTRSFTEFRKGMMEREQRSRETAKTAKAKAGGGNAAIGSPTAGMKKAAAVLIRDAFPDFPPEEVIEAASTIASRAKVLSKTQRLSEDEALRKALAEEKASFQTVEEAYTTLGFPHTRKTPRFVGGGKMPVDALEIPADKTLVPGRYYLHEGKPFLYKGGAAADAANWEEAPEGEEEE